MLHKSIRLLRQNSNNNKKCLALRCKPVGSMDFSFCLYMYMLHKNIRLIKQNPKNQIFCIGSNCYYVTLCLIKTLIAGEGGLRIHVA